MKIQRTVETSAAPGPVFAYLSDFTTTTEWDPGTVTTELVEGDGGVGTVYRNVSEFNGKESELRYEVVELVPERRFVLTGEGSAVHADDTMEFEPLGEGTRVTYTADIRFKGALKMAEPFLARHSRSSATRPRPGCARRSPSSERCVRCAADLRHLMTWIGGYATWSHMATLASAAPA